MPNSRFRIRFTFWLDMHKPDEQELSETVETLKTQKLFAKTIRDGIKLVVSLMDGRLDVLFSMYPWVREEFEKRSEQRSSQALEEQLARLEYLMEQGIRPTIDTGTIQTSSPVAGPKPLPAHSLSLPRFDDGDDDDTLVITKSQTSTSIMNFVSVMKEFQ